jgi:hypothetical protein
MTIRSTAGRGLIALVVLLLAAGTALAIDPSGSPSASPDSPSASPEASASAAASAEATASPVPSVSQSVAPTTTKPPASKNPDVSPAPGTSGPSETLDESNESDGPPSADKIADIVGRLKEAGITATAAQIQDLSAKVGVGGAVRVMAFAQASGKTPAQILAMFESGKGWGQIDHELGLSIGPGIGWIMGHGHGQGHGNGPKSERTAP